MKEKNATDIKVIGGGIIPEKDKLSLEKQGITGNFGPGTSMEKIIDHINKIIKNY